MDAYVASLRSFIAKAQDEIKYAKEVYACSKTRTALDKLRKAVAALKKLQGRLDEAVSSYQRSFVVRRRAGVIVTKEKYKAIGKESVFGPYPTGINIQAPGDIPVIANYILTRQGPYQSPYSIMPDLIVDAFYRFPHQTYKLPVHLQTYRQYIVYFAHRGGALLSSADIYAATGWKEFIAESRDEDGGLRFKIKITLASDNPPRFTVKLL